MGAGRHPRTGLGRSQDDAARGRARDLAALVADGLPRSVSGIGDDSVVQVVDAGGKVLSATPNLAGRPPVATFAPDGEDAEVRTVGVHDGREVEDYRVWAVRGSTPTGLVTVYVGSSLEAVAEAVSRPSELLVVGVPVVAALIGLVTWVVVGRALAPVGSIRAQVSDISDAELHRRVPEPATGDEIAQLARTMKRDAGPARDGQPSAARVRRGRLARAAEPAHPVPHAARGRPGEPLHHRPGRRSRQTCWRTAPRWSGSCATCCSSPVTRSAHRRRGLTTWWTSTMSCSTRWRGSALPPEWWWTHRACRLRRSVVAGTSSSDWSVTCSRTPSVMRPRGWTSPCPTAPSSTSSSATTALGSPRRSAGGSSTGSSGSTTRGPGTLEAVASGWRSWTPPGATAAAVDVRDEGGGATFVVRLPPAVSRS